MVTRYRNFEEMAESAQRAINDYYRTSAFKGKCNINDQFEETQVAWLQRLLDILKEKKYATIQLKNGNSIDVSAIAYTHDFLSFFDVINHLDYFDSSIEPITTKKLTNTIKQNLYDGI
jgi:hypothetical protein